MREAVERQVMCSKEERGRNVWKERKRKRRCAKREREEMR